MASSSTSGEVKLYAAMATQTTSVEHPRVPAGMATAHSKNHGCRNGRPQRVWSFEVRLFWVKEWEWTLGGGMHRITWMYFECTGVHGQIILKIS